MNSKLLEALQNGVVQVTFTKKSGEVRVMMCTLHPRLIPAALPLNESETKKERKANPEVQAVWDHESEGWRSFRWDSVTDFETIVTVTET